MKKIIITSGYFNPLHIGHINLIREAKKLGDFLVVIVNNDEQVKIKGSIPFMPEQERIGIIKALRYADDVILSIDRDSGRQDKTLTFLADKYKGNEIIFAKGGDSTMENVETGACKRLGIKIVLGVGGGKVQSSSWLLKSYGK